jgi:hypothetical protein
MKRILLALAAAAVLAAGGCGSAGGVIPDDFKILGTWIATSARYVSVSDPGTSVDLVAQGSTVTLVIQEPAFNLSIQTQGQNPVVYIGTWTQSGDGMEFTPNGAMAPWVFTVIQGQGTLSLGGAHVTYDFGSGPGDAIFSLDLYLQP